MRRLLTAALIAAALGTPSVAAGHRTDPLATTNVVRAWENRHDCGLRQLPYTCAGPAHGPVVGISGARGAHSWVVHATVFQIHAALGIPKKFCRDFLVSHGRIVGVTHRYGC